MSEFGPAVDPRPVPNTGSGAFPPGDFGTFNGKTARNGLLIRGPEADPLAPPPAGRYS